MQKFKILLLVFLLNSTLGHSSTNTNFSITKKYRFDYKVEIPAADNATNTFKLWVPYPREDQFQKVLKFDVATDLKYKITKEKKYGNRMVYFEGKRKSKPTIVWMTFIVERKPHTGISNKDTHVDLKNFLLPSKMVPLGGTISAIADEVAGSEKNTGKVIKKFYQYIVENMSYDKSGSGWGRGDAIWACDAKRGNCTDFHSLFIGMARSKKIPARFEMGIPIHASKKKAVVPGYHCWAEVYNKNKGWTPLDASEAKKRGTTWELFGKLPSDRIHFSRGRDIVLAPPQKGNPLNFFIYPYAEENGKPLKGVKQTFHYEIL